MKPLLSAAESWSNADPNPQTRRGLRELMARVETHKSPEDLEYLRSCFSGRVEFGTAGLRAAFGPGPARMNDLLILQAAQGLTSYILKKYGPKVCAERGVVLGYDHRESKEWGVSSRTFALTAAAVFLSRDVRVYLHTTTCPTPLVPFAVQRHKALLGCMVTASHNPKQDDGFKMYDARGVQIVSPTDAEVSSEIERNLTPWPESLRCLGEYDDTNIRSKCVSDFTTEACAEAYLHELETRLPMTRRTSPLPVGYTPMHGVGLALASRALARFRIEVAALVEEQARPDPDFPTVAFPNPEEAGALDLAMKTADEKGVGLILANDPDADRLAVAEKRRDGSWRVFTGDEIAALLGDWLWSRRPAGPGPFAMVVSAVSSDLLRVMGVKRGFLVEETLTGFKWIGSKACELRERGHTVLFSYEEAIGFCVGDVILDKDGISAACVFADMARDLRERRGISCSDRLREIHAELGATATANGYVRSKDPSGVFAGLRSRGREVSRSAKYRVTRLRDLGQGVDTGEPSGKPALPRASNMITYWWAATDGAGELRATLRGSGTEPKLKYYVEGRASNGGDEEAERLVKDFVETVVLGELLLAPASTSPKL